MNKRTDMWLTFLCAANLIISAIKADLHIHWLLDSSLPAGIFSAIIDVAAVGYLIYRGNYQVINHESAKDNPTK